MFHLVNLKGSEMDLEEVYLRQIVEQLKLQNKLKEDSNELLKAILDKPGTIEQCQAIYNVAKGDIKDADNDKDIKVRLQSYMVYFLYK